MNNLTQEDYKNILLLINRANITGNEATTTAILMQKLAQLATPTPPVNEPIKSVGEKEDEKGKADK